MSFDWVRFLDARSIRYVTTGPNVARGHVAVRCPFCGSADPSEHMGISLNDEGWACWRNRQHRGRNPAKLIEALLGCSYADAAAIAGRSTILPDDFMVRITQMLKPEAVDPPPARSLQMPKEFKPFANIPSAQNHINYLEHKRGFSRRDILHMTEDYDLRYCKRGPYGYRVIFPVFFEGKLVSWTGRDITGRAKLRYRTLPVDRDAAVCQGYEPAVGPINDYLLRYDHLMESDADTLVLVEGPIDAIKLSVLGRPHGIESTCFFTSGPTERQVQLLHTLLPRFRRRWLLLDQGTLPNALYIQGMLAGLSVHTKTLPRDIEDPGALRDVRFLLTGRNVRR